MSQHVQLSEQSSSWDTFACWWGFKQAASKQRKKPHSSIGDMSISGETDVLTNTPGATCDTVLLLYLLWHCQWVLKASLSLWILKASLSQWVLKALRPLCGSGSLKPLCGSGSLRPLCGNGSLRPLCGSGSLRPLCGSGSLRPVCRSGSLRPLCSSGSLKPLCRTGHFSRPVWRSFVSTSSLSWI